MKSTPGTTLAEKPSMSRVKLAMRVRPTGPLVTYSSGGHSYIMEDMDVRQGLSNPYPSQTKISANIWTLPRQMAENCRKYIPNTPENEFLAVYFCIIEKFRKISLI